MRNRKQTNRLIVHHSESRADVSWETVREWHLARHFSTWGYHYGISGDGTLHKGRASEKIGAHARGRNRDSIGVCLLGDFSKYEPTFEQLAALGELYHALCRFYGKRLTIEFHREGDNPCPGVKLDRDDLLEVVYRMAP